MTPRGALRRGSARTRRRGRPGSMTPDLRGRHADAAHLSQVTSEWAAGPRVSTVPSAILGAVPLLSFLVILAQFL
jgi:hypothetical protein